MPTVASKAPTSKGVSPALAIAVAVAVTIAAAWLHVPALPFLWFGLVCAASSSQMPVLSGKGKDGVPVPEGEREQASALVHRRWTLLRSNLIPSRSWVPWPVTPAALTAAAAAVAAWVLPTDLTRLWPVVELLVDTLWRTPFDAPDVETGWFPALNVAAAYVVAVACMSVASSSSDEAAEPAPHVTFRSVWTVMKGHVAWYITAAVVAAISVAAGVIVTVILARLPISQLLQPNQAIGAAVILLCIAGFVQATAGAASRRAWQQRTEARQVWAERFAAIPKVTEHLSLVEHRRCGPDDTWWLDTFTVPATLGSANDVVTKPGPYRLAVGNDFDTTIVSTLAITNGTPVANTRHLSRVDVITVPATTTFDVTDPAADAEQLELWLRIVIAKGAERGAVATMLIDSVTPLHNPDSTDTLACWSVEVTHPDPGVLMSTFAKYAGPFLAEVANELAATPPVEVIFDTANGRILVGAFDGVDFLDPSILELRHRHYRQEELEEAWMLTAAKFPAHPQFAVEVATQIGGVELHRLPHAVPKGQPPERYLALDVEELATTFGATHAALTYYPEMQAGRRAPTPHKAAFSLVWTTSRGSVNPANIAPVPMLDRNGEIKTLGGRPTLENSDSNGILDLLSLSIYRAFRSAKIDQPYIVAVKPLTMPDSGQHLWAIDLRLYGRTTIGQLRTRATLQILQDRMDVEYLRVVESASGVRLIVGAMPEQVQLLSEREKALIVQADWEQAFIDTNLTSGGKGPTFLSISNLEHNPKVDTIQFRLPGGSVTLSKVRAAVEKLRSTTRNRFIDIRRPEGMGEDEILVLACTSDPVPFPAPWDWNVVAESEDVPFGVGVEGEPCAWIPADSPHVVLLGATRSGKSIAMLDVFGVVLIRGWDLLLADAQKGLSDFVALKPYARAFATEPATFHSLAQAIEAELDERTALASSYSVANFADLPEEVRPKRMLIAIDEFTSMAQGVAGKLRTPPPDASDEAHRQFRVESAKYEGVQRLVQAVGRVLREGGAWGVSLMLAGQSLTKADADALAVSLSTFKNNSAIFAVGAMRSSAYLSAFGEVPEIDLGESVPKGRGIFRDLSGAQRIIQTWFDGPDRSDNISALLERVAAVREPCRPEDIYELEHALDDTAVFRPRTFGRVIAAPNKPAQLDQIPVLDSAEAVAIDDIDLAQVDVLDLELTMEDLTMDATTPEQSDDAGNGEEPLNTLDNVPSEPQAESAPRVVVDDDDDDDWLNEFDIDEATEQHEDLFGFDTNQTEAAPEPAPVVEAELTPTTAPSVATDDLFAFANEPSDDDPFGFDTPPLDDNPFGFALSETHPEPSEPATTPSAQPRLMEESFDDLFGTGRQ